MRILILNWRDPKHPLRGGAETALYQHAIYWKHKGAHITWIASSFPTAKKEEVCNGINMVRAGSHYTVHMWALFYFMRGKLNRPDIIIDCFHFIPFFSLLYPTKAKIVSVIHEIAGKLWFLNLSLPFSFIGYKVEPFIVKLYKKTIFFTVSNSTRNALIKLAIPKSNIHIIHNGISVPPSQNILQKEKKPTIIFVGRISEDKGIRDALEAFLLLADTYRELQFWIVGKEEKLGDWAKITEEIVMDESMRKRIMYYGFVSETKKFALLSKAWLLVHPSQKEGWGLTVIEAARQKTPTIGYNVEGLKDSVINGKTGLLTNKDAQSLASGIKKLLDNKTLYKTMCKDANIWSQKFRWEESTQASWKLINSLIKS